MRWTKKHGRSFFGYKNHVNADAKHKLIRHYAVTDAAVHACRLLLGAEKRPAFIKSGSWAGRPTIAPACPDPSMTLLDAHSLAHGLARLPEKLGPVA